MATEKKTLDPEPVRGLPSVIEARKQIGKKKMLPTRYWMWAIVFIGAGIIVWWKLEEGEINKMRNELLGRQRAVVEELGPRWFPLRDRIADWTQECAVEALTDHIDPEVMDKAWSFRDKAGIYLRLAQPNAETPEKIREAATKSLRDGFTSCLLVVENKSPISGAKCHTNRDCPRGNMCNEFYHCAEHSQPYNLRVAFKTMHIMTDEWVADIQDVSNKLAMRGVQATFEEINDYDLPVAVDLLARSKYFLVVVDELVKADEQDIDQSLPDVDAGTQDDRSIPTAAHPARVCLWRLEDGKKMLALRREAAGTLRGPGVEQVPLQTRIAQQRQANSCSLALAVREAIGAERAPSVPEQLNPDEGEQGPDEGEQGPDDRKQGTGGGDGGTGSDK